MQLQWEHEVASGFYQCRHWMIQEGYFCLREVVGGKNSCLVFSCKADWSRHFDCLSDTATSHLAPGLTQQPALFCDRHVYYAEVTEHIVGERNTKPSSIELDRAHFPKLSS